MTEHTRRPATNASRWVTIDHLGGGGDGIARADDETWFVARALPGETVRARPGYRNREGVHAEAVRIHHPAPDRQAAPCAHFADPEAPCGGCSLQHLAPAAYRSFKRGLITHALGRRGLAIDSSVIAEPVITPERTRRRVMLTAVGSRGGTILGFHQRRSKRIVDIADCVVAVPAITGALPELREAMASALRPGERAALAITALDGGLSIEITGPARPPERRARARLVTAAGRLDASRLGWRARPGRAFVTLADRRPAVVSFDGVPVTLPYDAFLQATAEGERSIRNAVEAAIGASEAAAVADLYAGCGSLSVPLARQGCRVRAIEGDETRLAALQAAAEEHALPVDTECRDLAVDPPGAADLAAFDAVVFDPPRAGARALAGTLARAPVPTVVAVSCHPGTFARDARTLVDGGYRLTHVQPIDQFRYTHHVELVAVFRRTEATVSGEVADCTTEPAE